MRESLGIGVVVALTVIGCGGSHKSDAGAGGSGAGGGAGASAGQSAGGLGAGGGAHTMGGTGMGGSSAGGTGVTSGSGGTANATGGTGGSRGGTGTGGMRPAQGGQSASGAAGKGTSGAGGTAGDAGTAGASGAPDGVIHAGDETACDQSFANPDCWSVYDVSGRHPTGSFMGGAFDGRYVYFVSSGDANVTGILRYDTQGSFTDDASFSVFNLAKVNQTTHKFAGAGFDGRYFYLVPFDWAYSTTTSRYDTHAAFDAAGSWSNFDLTPVSGAPPFAMAYVGAVFDGRYLYYVPNCFYEYWRGTTLRFDTQGTFDSTTDWSVFDTLSLDDNAGGYRGGTFDGRYVYFAPYGDMSTGTTLFPTTLAVRYDTQADYTAKSSWITFDMTMLSNTPGYAGAVFDGTYVYYPSADYRGRLTRFDSRKAFDAADSWQVFEMTSAADGVAWLYNGGVFDGRYVYLVPDNSVPVRFDTTLAFDTKSAYETTNLATLDAAAGHYAGGVFDGRYVYFVPSSSNHVARFEARADHALPASNGASFY